MCTDQVRRSDRAVPNYPRQNHADSERAADGCQSPDPGIQSFAVACQEMPRRRAIDTVSAHSRLSPSGCRVAPCGGDRPHGTRLTKNRDRPVKCRGIRIRHGLRNSHGESAEEATPAVASIACSAPRLIELGCGTRYASWRPRKEWCGPIRPRDLPIQWRVVPGTLGWTVPW